MKNGPGEQHLVILDGNHALKVLGAQTEAREFALTKRGLESGETNAGVCVVVSDPLHHTIAQHARPVEEQRGVRVAMWNHVRVVTVGQPRRNDGQCQQHPHAAVGTTLHLTTCSSAGEKRTKKKRGRRKQPGKQNHDFAEGIDKVMNVDEGGNIFVHIAHRGLS